MVMSLFSVFDPSVYGFSFMWLVLTLVFLYIGLFYYVINSIIFVGLGDFKEITYRGFSDISSPNGLGLAGFGVGLFLFIYINNLLGLFSYIFSSTSHVFVTLGLGLMLWLGCFMMGWFSNFLSSAAHLVPLGSPLILAPLLVCIESVSHFIRPITLSVRLAANMMAGHLIIGLISSISEVGMLCGFVSVLLQLCLMMLELAVTMIQGLVFSILFMLYAMEYY